jgi:hypothetical protein
MSNLGPVFSDRRSAEQAATTVAAPGYLLRDWQDDQHAPEHLPARVFLGEFFT